MSAQYDALGTEEIPMSQTGSRTLSRRGSNRSDGPIALRSPPRVEDKELSARASLDSAGTESDIVYHDQLDQDPFQEKDSEAQRFHQRYEDDDEQGYVVEPSRLRPRRKSRKILAFLVLVVTAAGAIGVLAAWWYSGPSYAAKSGNRHLTLDHIFNGTFSPYFSHHDWVKEAEDGTYSTVDGNGDILLATASEPNVTSVLVKASDVKDPRTGKALWWRSWKLSADMKYVLFGADTRKQWRHSSHSNFFVHRLSDHKTFALHELMYPPTVAYAEWSPVSHAIAFVADNDLYVISADGLDEDKPKPVRVTNDGSAVVFNGVPDWVYEEEVFSTDFALWWAPDAHAVAYLRSNETDVKVYSYPMYNPSNNAQEPHPYTKDVDMRYPKPGTPLPLVSVHTFSLDKYFAPVQVGAVSVEDAKETLHWPGQLPEGEGIIVEVAWVADDALLVKEIDRAARNGQVIAFQKGNPEGKAVRKLGKDGEEGDDGWIDHGQHVLPVKETDGTVSGYLDIVPKNGYDHVAFFTSADSGEPIWLTEGEWEVTDISGLNQAEGIVYFTAATPSIDRHIYSVKLPNRATLDGFKPEMQALTDTSQAGYYSASFSPQGGYYSLKYEGPLVPWQRLIQVGEDGLDVLLQDNKELNETLAEYARPIETRTTLQSGDYELNVLEMLPPNIDTSGRKKYPLLIHVYGGPYSQQVSNKFKRDWHAYLACEEKYVVVKIDGRGTGFKGRQLRNPIIDDIGHWEVEDQIALAREVVKRKYIDRNRVGIWGWSYGGYMTLKTLEANPDLFTLGMAVAPVTDWRYYDAIYTERYMNTPQDNPAGYRDSAVRNVTKFQDVDLALAHGSGDDNVHFANTAHLVDELTQNSVRGWRMRMFTDSDHSIYTRGANRELYEWLLAFLREKWGKGGKVRH